MSRTNGTPVVDPDLIPASVAAKILRVGNVSFERMVGQGLVTIKKTWPGKTKTKRLVSRNEALRVRAEMDLEEAKTKAEADAPPPLLMKDDFEATRPDLEALGHQIAELQQQVANLAVVLQPLVESLVK